ncbi:hypothetical protein THIARS_60900 [Thiomonas delicata]|uniref:Uncharacterized protein n=1 Tax=Thiomonas delicata TaxID=364030 RepID=A0A238D4F7_THIDL|nr:hypothetical protein THIARS_60900 [Thiomonas delicata]
MKTSTAASDKIQMRPCVNANTRHDLASRKTSQVRRTVGMMAGRHRSRFFRGNSDPGLLRDGPGTSIKHGRSQLA